MSILVQSPHSPIDNSVPAYIAPRPKFLLRPPPPPKQKRALKAARLPKPPTPPHSRRTRKVGTVPRSPLSPRQSFLNILDTPSPPNSVNKRREASPLLFSELGYNIAIEAFYASKPSSITVPVTPRPTASEPKERSTSTAKTVLLNMNVLSRQQTNTSHNLLKPSSATKNMTPLYPRSNNNGETSSSLCPPMPEYTHQRRGSLPTSQNRPRSSTKSSSQVEKDINKAHKKRYPLPLPYGAVVELDQILGDARSAQSVSYRIPHAASSAHSRGATPVGPNGQVSTGRPYVGADGRIWRDREEELEYAGLLANGDTPRRGSDDTTTSLDDGREERHGRRAWAKFGANSSRQGTATYDAFQASERLRTPQSATSSSSAGEDEDEQAWSPLVVTHPAQHQFPNYVFPASSKSSRASSSTVASNRAIPLPASVNDFAVPSTNTKTPTIHHVPKAKEDFLASAFAPIPQSSNSSTRRSDRERERATRPPTSTHESRMTARRSSVQGVGHNEIVIPLPSLRPSHQPHAPSSNSSLRADPEKGKEKHGFLGVFKKK